MRKKAGVTLVEVMVALFILGIGFTSLFSGFLHSRRLAQGSIYQNTASTIALSYLQQIKSIEFVALDQNPIRGLMSEGANLSLTVSPNVADASVGANTDIANEFTIDTNNTPAIEEDDMNLRIYLYLQDITDEANGIAKSRRITIRYEADFVAAGYTQTFKNVIRSIRSNVPTF